MGELSNTTINGVSYDFKDAGAARQSHSHTKSQITDFPTSMPASDVSAWAKASTKPTYTASEVGAVPNTAAGVSAAINQLTTGDSAPTDNDYYVSQYAGGGTSTTTYHRRPVSKLWDYIKSKLTSTTTSANLTDTEKSNARANIGAAAASDVAVSYISLGDFFTPYSSGSILSETPLFKQGKHIFGFIKVEVMSIIPLVGTVKTPYRPAIYNVPGMLYLQSANDPPQPIPCTINADGSIIASNRLISGAFVYFYVDYIIA